MTNNNTAIPSEQGHWYHRDGSPCYTVKRADGKGERATHIGDARKLDLLPSVTTISSTLSQPGLIRWKLEQAIDAALTLPRIDKETLDDYKVRVIKDANEKGEKARNAGTALHKAIEQSLLCQPYAPEFFDHIKNIRRALQDHGIDLRLGDPERSFACNDLGYGGKIDWSALLDDGVPTVIDFKSKDKIDDSKKMLFAEHSIQIAPYLHGVFGVEFDPFFASHRSPRGINVFVGIKDKQVRVFEHAQEDLHAGFETFRHLLAAWQIQNRFPVLVP